MYIRKPSIFSSLSFSFNRRGSHSRTQNYFAFVQEEHSFICLLQVPGSVGNCSWCILIFSSSLCASPRQTFLSTPQELTVSWAADRSRGSLAGGLSHEEGHTQITWTAVLWWTTKASVVSYRTIAMWKVWISFPWLLMKGWKYHNFQMAKWDYLRKVTLARTQFYTYLIVHIPGANSKVSSYHTSYCACAKWPLLQSSEWDYLTLFTRK